MNPQDDSTRRSPHRADDDPISHTIPIIQTPTIHTPAQSPGDAMDFTSPSTVAMGPPARNSPEGDSNGAQDQSMGDQGQHGSASGPNAAAAAQAGSQAPKVVQTAFIHKLYNMLEDPSIQHLISWSTSAESFVMSPSNDFSKVLSQYFKHTNISSFVRQLNMYGFHKVSDVFHSSSPESPLWEFKHGNGNFKRGDLVGLREIKRRASRHALIHRDSYPSVKPPPYTQPGTPAEFVQPMQESNETRLAIIQQSLSDVQARLVRSEDNSQLLNVRNQVIMDALSRSLQLNNEMSRVILSILPNPDSPIHRSIQDMQGEIQRQAEILRSFEDQSDVPFPSSRSYFSSHSHEQAPISPRQLAQDDPRRPAAMTQSVRQSTYKPALPTHLSVTTSRRYGSIGSTSTLSPSSLRYQAPPPPPLQPHPLASVQSPPTGLPRRHTSADIRAHGWQPTPSPFATEHASSQWPPSPKRGPISEDQRIRESFSSYSLQAASQHRSNGSRPATPPFTNGSGTSIESLGTWSWGQGGRADNFGGSGFGSSGLLKDNSGPPTRRSSMAHILNPAETVERADEHEEELRDEDRKRKRV